MKAGASGGRHTGLRVVWLVPAVGILLLGAGAGRGDRITLRPRLQNGGKLGYEMHGRLERDVKTKSNVATMMSPRGVRGELSIGLRLTVQEIREVGGRPMMAAETELVPLEVDSGGNARPKHPKVNFTVGGSGEVTRADGLDNLDDELRLAWQFWISQFAFGWTLPQGGVQPGEKWKSEEAEKTPTPIAGLVWERETTYVENDRCPVVPEERCASFLSVSTLRQKSNPKDATPEDYRLRELKTSGTVSGRNQTVSYYSLKTGLLMRATEDVQQSMDVTIAKADGSNQVQYQVEAMSHFETVLAPATIRPAQ
jgi:hypothetical protein